MTMTVLVWQSKNEPVGNGASCRTAAVSSRSILLLITQEHGAVRCAVRAYYCAQMNLKVSVSTSLALTVLGQVGE
jgi:hypothetical protein